MKIKVISAVSILFTVLTLQSCEKVINIDLNSSAPATVIEGSIVRGGYCRVMITETVNFNEANIFPPVRGAVLKFHDGTGHDETLQEVAPGTYAGFLYKGKEGESYTIEVSAGGKSFRAFSTMVAAVPVDTVWTTSGSGFGSGLLKGVSISFHDPAGKDNYYRLTSEINGTPFETINITSDRLRDGQQISLSFRPRDNDNNGILKTGDIVSLHLQSIGKDVFDYFRTLEELKSSGYSGSTPANPLSNFTGGALGYFSAYSESAVRIELK